jgi:pimeloyl-ACP methyl ester carboxylesterase
MESVAAEPSRCPASQESQMAYVLGALRYLVRQYNITPSSHPGVLLLGHSMGGVVARAAVHRAAKIKELGEFPVLLGPRCNRIISLFLAIPLLTPHHHTGTRSMQCFTLLEPASLFVCDLASLPHSQAPAAWRCWSPSQRPSSAPRCSRTPRSPASSGPRKPSGHARVPARLPASPPSSRSPRASTTRWSPPRSRGSLVGHIGGL